MMRIWPLANVFHWDELPRHATAPRVHWHMWICTATTPLRCSTPPVEFAGGRAGANSCTLEPTYERMNFRMFTRNTKIEFARNTKIEIFRLGIRSCGYEIMIYSWLRNHDIFMVHSARGQIQKDLTLPTHRTLHFH